MELKKDRVIKLFNKLGIEAQPYERNPKLLQISQEDCQRIGNNELWKSWTDEERGMVALYMPLMIMPFDELHRCMEVALGRSVWTHEMGLNWNGLVDELENRVEKPTMTEIFELILEEKRVIVHVED